MDSRSFHYKGRRFPICARCTGELAGILFALATFPWFRPQLPAVLLLMVPMLLDGGLQMLCAVVATGTWMPICSTSDGTYTFVNGTPYIFTFYNNDGVITSQACSGDLQDGRTYTVYAADVFSISGDLVNIPHELPAYLPAGELTLVKTSSENTSAKLSTSVTGRKAAGNATTTSLSSARQ